MSAMKNLSFALFSLYRGQLMGIAILGVCVLHALAWAGVEETLATKVLSLIARVAFTEGFLFLSGFGLYYSFCKNGDVHSFYKKRIHRVLLPYMIMTAPFFLYRLIGGSNSLSETLLKSSSLYFWFFGNDGMWYISMSMALYFVFPFAYRFIFENQEEREILSRTLLLVVVSILGCYALYLFVPDYYDMVTIGISKTPIFFIGMLFGHYALKQKAITLKQIFGGGYIVMHNIPIKE